MKLRLVLSSKDIIASSFVTHVQKYFCLKGNDNFLMFSSRILKLRTSIDLNQVLILNIYDNSNFWVELSCFAAMLNFLPHLLLHSFQLFVNSFSAASIEQYLNGLKKINEFPSAAGLQYQLVRLRADCSKLEFKDWDCHNFM